MSESISNSQQQRAAAAAVLVIGHGSRRREANDDVRNVARLIGERGGFPLVRAAFLEIEQPSIEEGFASLVEQGACDITVHPYFLSPGRHTRGDVPVEVREAAAKHPHVVYRITEPLSAHPLVIAASIERIRESEGQQFSSLPRLEATHAVAGRVYIVGAGPGDPGLLTIKARDLLASCDTVVYDYLVNPEILRYSPPHAEHVYVGKVGGGRQTPQDEINRLLVAHALTGKSVVRLKGGDPFIFGRGAEEAEALTEAGVAFEVVPGITSAIAVPAYAGIPLTHRSLSSSVAVVTGTRAAMEEENSLSASACRADTLVILMGISHLREIAAKLLAAGRAPDTPVAVIRWGTYEGQQTVVGDLTNIAVRAEASNLRAPAVIVVGETVRLRERLSWFEKSSNSAREHSKAPNFDQTEESAPVHYA
ncbi:MAG: uroporphyrinogen-III C-methyltransferase [Pyrinomonadaceae bacterium]